MAIVLNEKSRTVCADGRCSLMTPTEWSILSLLMQNYGEIMTAESIYQHVWHCRPYQCNLIISVHVRHIREKIEKDPSHPRYLKTARQQGYWIADEKAS